MKKRNYTDGKVRIHIKQIYLGHDCEALYIILTESRNFQPYLSYSFEIADNLKNLNLNLYSEVEERYFPYCPN